MFDDIPDVESLTSEELLSIILSTVAPAEADSDHEYGLRFDAQRAATELYCRASSSRRVEAVRTAAPLQDPGATSRFRAIGRRPREEA